MLQKRSLKKAWNNKFRSHAEVTLYGSKVQAKCVPADLVCALLDSLPTLIPPGPGCEPVTCS